VRNIHCIEKPSDILLSTCNLKKKGLIFVLAFKYMQTWNLSKILHPRIFRPKILHRQFHLISTVLVIKTQKKMSENGEIYTSGKKFTLPPAVTALTNSNSEYM